MRAWLLAMSACAVAACGGDDRTGALVTLHASDHPTVDSIEILLASADPAQIAPITGQRTGASLAASETVVYYHQRSTSGVVDVAGDLDGFKLRIEANPSEVPDIELIPFVVARAGGKIVALGTFHAQGAAPDPVAITVDPHSEQVFSIDMEQVTQGDPDGAQVMPMECTVVSCGFDSGLVWRPSAGEEVRLLLPETGDDATDRALDLDCDAHDVDQDCDDLHGDAFAGADEACDGRDTNCDGATSFATTCAAQGCSGVAVCDDSTAEELACQADATCPGTSAATCTIATHGVDACAPAASELQLPGLCDDGCDATIFASDGVWDAFVSTSTRGPWAQSVTTSAKLAIEIVPHGTVPPTTTAMPNSVGQVFLGIIPKGETTLHYVPVRLEYGASGDCHAIDMSTDDQMKCDPPPQ